MILFLIHELITLFPSLSIGGNFINWSCLLRKKIHTPPKDSQMDEYVGFVDEYVD